MAALEPSSRGPSFAPAVPPFSSHAPGTADADGMVLTESQKQILAMLDDVPHSASAEAAPTASGGGFGLDVAFATVGALCVVSGVMLVFFFAALGSVVLVLGAVLCAVAFEHVALRDLRAEEDELIANAIRATADDN